MGERPASVLVAGVGFVGSYILAETANAVMQANGVDLRPNLLTSELPASGPHVVRRLDLSRRADTSRALEEIAPDAVVIASRLDGGDKNDDALRFLVHESAARGVSQLVLISSLAVYGAAQRKGGLVESAEPADPSGYGIEKLREEQIFRDASARAGVSHLIMRSTGMFGRLPTPRPSNRSAGAIDRLLREYVRGEPPVLTIEDAPDQYLYARDLGKVVVRAIENPPPFDVLNVGTGRLLAPEETRFEISAALGVPVALELRDRTGPPIDVLNVDRLYSWYPEDRDNRCDFASGLRAAAEDFESGVQNSRVT